MAWSLSIRWSRGFTRVGGVRMPPLDLSYQNEAPTISTVNLCTGSTAYIYTQGFLVYILYINSYMVWYLQEPTQGSAIIRLLNQLRRAILMHVASPVSIKLETAHWALRPCQLQDALKTRGNRWDWVEHQRFRCIYSSGWFIRWVSLRRNPRRDHN